MRILRLVVVGSILFLLGGQAGMAKEEPAPLPIVYSKHYNITLFGIQKLHPLDSEKYGKAFKYLKKNGNLSKDRVYVPEMVSDDQLLMVHTQEYLDTLKKSSTVAQIAEMGLLKAIPNTVLQHKILRPMKYATGGTILASHLAMQYGWAVNLSGGYHHAKADQGEGFCFYADIPIAAHVLWEKWPDMKIMVVDLDAHQGNGHEAVFKNDPRVFIFDLYNEEIYPGDYDAQEFVDFDHPVESYIEDEPYLNILGENLAPAMEQCAPGIIIYNAGTDIYEEDPLGDMSISEDGIIKRDEIVFGAARRMNIPVVMVLSGGYTKQSAKIVGKSVQNLLENVLRVDEMRMARADY